MHNFDLETHVHDVDYIMESIEIVAAFSSCKGGATSVSCKLTQYLTESEAVVKLKYLPFLATP